MRLTHRGYGLLASPGHEKGSKVLDILLSAEEPWWYKAPVKPQFLIVPGSLCFRFALASLAHKSLFLSNDFTVQLSDGIFSQLLRESQMQPGACTCVA